jgi:hypothetical protein
MIKLLIQPGKRFTEYCQYVPHFVKAIFPGIKNRKKDIIADEGMNT